MVIPGVSFGCSWLLLRTVIMTYLVVQLVEILLLCCPLKLICLLRAQHILDDGVNTRTPIFKKAYSYW